MINLSKQRLAFGYVCIQWHHPLWLERYRSNLYGLKFKGQLAAGSFVSQNWKGRRPVSPKCAFDMSGHHLQLRKVVRMEGDLSMS